MEIALFLTAIVTIATYCTASIIKFGVPKSISDTHYLWQGEAEALGHLFTLVLWVVAFTLLPVMLEHSTEGNQWLAFISCGALAFVGAASEFKEALTHNVHYGAAYVWAVASVIWSILNASPVPLCIGVFVGILGYILDNGKDKTFWEEIACIVCLMTSITNLLLA